MDITYKTEGELLVISMSGEMDHHNLINVRLATDPIIMQTRPKVLVLDMSKVPFCDSSGIAAVLGRYKLVRSLGGQLLLHGLNDQVRKVLNLGGVFNLVKEVQKK